MTNFNITANVRVKQYLCYNTNSQDKRAIKSFFEDLKTKGLYAARRTALVRGSSTLVYLIDGLSQDYVTTHKF